MECHPGTMHLGYPGIGSLVESDTDYFRPVGSTAAYCDTEYLRENPESDCLEAR